MRDSAVRGTILGEGNFVRLVRLDGGWEFAQRRRCSGIAVIIAVTDDDRLLLVEQFRPAIGRPVIELPAGLAGDVPGQEDELLTAAAHRELIEETGFRATQMIALAHGPPSAGISDEVITYLRATGLSRIGAGGGDATEQIEVHALPLAQVHSWLEGRARQGAMIDPKVYGGLYFARYAEGLD